MRFNLGFSLGWFFIFYFLKKKWSAQWIERIIMGRISCELNRTLWLILTPAYLQYKLTEMHNLDLAIEWPVCCLNLFSCKSWFCKWEFCLFLFLKLRFIIYYYDHYWLEYLSHGPISGYGIIWNGLFSFLFLTPYPDNRKWADKIGSFWFQTVKRWILNFYCRRDSYNLFIRYFTDLVQWCLFTEHIR